RRTIDAAARSEYARRSALMSCRAMVTCPASSGNEQRSATTLRVNSTLPAPMIATRIMSESVPCMPQVSKCEQSYGRTSWVWPGLDGDDLHAGFGQGGQDCGVGGLVGDQLVDRSDRTDLGEGHEADLGAVGYHDDRTGALDQCPVRMGLHLVMRCEAGLEGDPIRAHEHDVEVQPA